MLNVNQSQKSFLGALPVPRELRCLLLDDSTFDRARIRRMSKKTNLSIFLDEVDCIGKLATAVNAEPYDVILIDYRLPVGDGLLALQHTLQSTKNADAAKIMITGYGAENTAKEALNAGCHDFLVKEQMNVEALRKAMMKALTTAGRDQVLASLSTARPKAREKGLIVPMPGISLQDTDLAGGFVSQEGAPVRAKANQQHRSRQELDVDALLAVLDNQDGLRIH